MREKVVRTEYLKVNFFFFSRSMMNYTLYPGGNVIDRNQRNQIIRIGDGQLNKSGRVRVVCMCHVGQECISLSLSLSLFFFFFFVFSTPPPPLKSNL